MSDNTNENLFHPPPPTEREHRLADTLDASLDEIRQMTKKEGAVRTQSFMNRYRTKAQETITHAAFHDFFELAAKLNESAHALGIRCVGLDADSGDVSVTYRSRPAITEADEGVSVQK